MKLSVSTSLTTLVLINSIELKAEAMEEEPSEHKEVLKTQSSYQNSIFKETTRPEIVFVIINL